MKFGCSTLLYGGYSLEESLEGMQRAGYEAIELCHIPGMGEHVELGREASYYQEVKGKLDAAGLALDSIGASGSLGNERFEPVLKAAAALGAPYVTCGSGGKADDEESFKAFCSTVKEALPPLHETGVKLSIKPHVGSSLKNPAMCLRFVEEVGDPHVGINFDNTHIQRHGTDPVQAVKELKDVIFTARIRDYKSDNLSIGPVENQIPGKGIVDVKGYFHALCGVPGLQFATVEMVGAKEFPLSEVQRIVEETIAALKSYL